MMADHTKRLGTCQYQNRALYANGIVLNYALPGFIAAIIALPLSYFFMDEWLPIFAYRFQFGVSTILVAILLGILLPLTGGFLHALKIASESPSAALRED